ncbi:MAG: DUF1552 domain-containing protein [Bryobacterales bacterium]|nr:DUF1552 domain-containing protein [Acidobacteriota bacterium]MCB9383980.1 DUF1552 domain-containing protein [Bryobacterales bacterium]
MHPLRPLRLSRRTVLRGIGASLCLPWLEAMAPAAVSGETGKREPIRRMAALFMPNGVHPKMWTPEEEGRNFKLSPTLEPLKGLEKELLVLTNLWNAASNEGDGHYVKVSGLLTCTTITKTLGFDVNCNGVSMDQVAARAIKGQTPLASLELGTRPVTTGVDRNVGYTRVYGSHIAWAGPTQPLAREIDPRLAYERLYRATQPQGEQAKRDLVLLDRVLEDAKQLRTKLGQEDRRRVDEYLSVVRSLEERLDRAAQPQQTVWKPRVEIDPNAKPEGIPDNFEEHVKLMLDVMALAFQSDTTRVSTFMMGNSVSNQNFAWLEGVDGSHHETSHHQNDPEKMRQYQLINRWHIEQYGYLLRKLQGMQEGDSTVLDNSMVLFGSGFRDGNAHSPHNLPIVVAGRAGGRLDTGQHLVYTEDSPLADLYVSLLDAFGAPMERFADSVGPLRGVLRS